MQFTYTKPVAIAAVIPGGKSQFKCEAAIINTFLIGKINTGLIVLAVVFRRHPTRYKIVEPRCLQNQLKKPSHIILS
jgi:hypothetical protein